MTAALSVAQKETLEKFVTGAYVLDKLVGFLTEEQLDLSMAAGEWTIRQIVHHMAEDGEVWSMMIKRAIALNGIPVTFPEFPGNDAWAGALGYDKRPIRGAIALFKSHRHVIAEIAVFFAESWDNYISLAMPESKEPARVTIGQVVNMLTDHLAEHIITIETIREKYGIE